MVSKIFGSPKPQTVSTSDSPFSQLPQIGKDAFTTGVGGAIDIYNDPDAFLPAEFSGQTQQAFDILSNQANPLTAQQFGDTVSLFQDPFEEQVIQNALSDIQREGGGILSNIGSQASDAGAFGGTRQALLEAEGQRNILDQMARTGAQLRSQGFQQASERALNEIGRQRMGALDLLGVGQSMEARELAERQAPMQAVNFLLGAAQGIPTASGSRATYNDPGILSRASQGLSDIGSVASGIGTIGGLFSDRRLKEDVEYSRSENGHNLYTYKYKFSPEYYEGVMADEVLENSPDAISNVLGFMAVDYSKLGLELRVL